MRRLLCVLLCVVLLSACTPPVPSTPTQAPSMVAATATPAPPTATATATATRPSPTATPEPTLTPTPVPTALPITAGNYNGLALARMVGNGRVEQMAWSADGNSVAMLTSVHLLKVDAANGETAWQMETGVAQQQVAFTANGTRLVTLGAGGAVKVWDAADGKLLESPVSQQVNVLYASLSQDGSIVVMTNVKRETAVWDVASGAEIFNNKGVGMPAEVAGVLAGPDGSWFATSAYDTYGPNQQIKLWETRTGKPILGLMGINNDFITDLGVSPDGRYIIGVSRLQLTSLPEYSLVVWNAKTGAQLHRYTQSSDILNYSATPKDSLVFSTETGQLEVLSLASGLSTGTYTGVGQARIYTLQLSPDGSRLATAGSDGALRLWDTQKRAELHRIDLHLSSKADPCWVLGHNYLLRSARAFGIGVPADGAFVVAPSIDRTGLNVVDPVSLLTIRNLGKSHNPIAAVAVSTDGKWAAGSDYLNVYLWDVASGRLSRTIQTKQRNVIQKLTFSPDGALVYTLSSGELYGYSVETGQLVSRLSGYNTVDFSPDGARVISDNIDFGLYFWDALTSRQLALNSADWILDVDFSPDGKTIAIAGWELHRDIKEHTNLVTFMDATSYAIQPVQLSGNVAEIKHVRYSPDGSLLAWLDEYGNLQLWDVATGERLQQIESVAPAPGYLEFLAGGRAIVVGSADGTLRFYELKR